MSKKNVLGSDPFEWLKKDEKKENTGNKKIKVGGQKKQTEKPLEPEGVDGTGAKSKIQGSKAAGSSKIEKTLKLNKIQYEPSGVSETDKLEKEKTFVSSDISEENRKAVLGKDVYAHHAKSRKAIHKDSPATAFVIVYTVLLLILGFIVYKDMTKQINRLETKLELVEKKLDGGLIDYEDTGPYKC